jgi:hypothetical protein
MKHFFYIIVLIALFGCSGMDKPKKPTNLIGKDKMTKIMYDVYILNAAKGVNRKLLELNGVMPLDYVYKKHGIDSLQFAESNTYYAYDTEDYAAMIENVKLDLQKNKDLYEKLNKEEQKLDDSINGNNKKGKRILKEIEDPLPQ